MRIILKHVLIGITLLATSSAALATDYYLDPVSGKDAPAGGTAKAPWKTLAYAVSQAYSKTSAGNHRFLLAAGTFKGDVAFPVATASTFGVQLVGAGVGKTIVDGTISGTMQGMSVTGCTVKSIDAKGPLFGIAFVVDRSSVTGRLALSSAVPVQRAPSSVSITRSRLGEVRVQFSGQTSLLRGLLDSCYVGAAGVLVDSLLENPFRVLNSQVVGKVTIDTGDGGDATLRNSIIAGGVRLEGTYFGNSDFIVDRCVISGGGVAGVSAHFFPARNYQCTLALIDSVIYGSGQGLLLERRRTQPCRDSVVSVLRCAISGNRQNGILVQGLQGCAISVDSTVIAGNGLSAITVEEDASSYNHRSQRDLVVLSSILARNGSGIRFKTGSRASTRFRVSGCTVVDNVQVGIDRAQVTDGLVDHTILAGSKVALAPKAWSVTYCLSDNATLPGTSNLRADPRFVGRDVGNYRLSRNSPAIDAGTTTPTKGVDFEGDARRLALASTTVKQDIGADEVSLVGTGYTFGPSAATWGRPRLAISARRHLKIGGALDIVAKGALRSDVLFWIAHLAEGPVVDLGPLGHKGIAAYMNPTWLLPATRGTNGDGLLVANMPNIPGFVGAGLTVQAIAGSSTGVSVSQLLRFAIGK